MIETQKLNWRKRLELVRKNTWDDSNRKVIWRTESINEVSTYRVFIRKQDKTIQIHESQDILHAIGKYVEACKQEGESVIYALPQNRKRKRKDKQNTLFE